MAGHIFSVSSGTNRVLPRRSKKDTSM
jgi:hypothetical protein